MARKKRAQRGAAKRVSKKVSSRKSLGRSDAKRKITIVLNNLLLFVALSLVSFVLFRFLQNDILVKLFYAMSMVFGSVSVAFLITLLILLVMKIIRKK